MIKKIKERQRINRIIESLRHGLDQLDYSYTMNYGDGYAVMEDENYTVEKERIMTELSRLDELKKRL